MHWKRNPDFETRQLERNYKEDPSLENGVALLDAYVKSDEIDAIGSLLPVLDEQYAEYGPYTDILIEGVLITAHFLLGHDSRDLCDAKRTILCKYSKPLIWDYMQGYIPGSTQAMIDAINQELFNKRLVTEIPTRYNDQKPYIHTSILKELTHHPEHFRNSSKNLYALSLFHETSVGQDTFFRVVWNNISIDAIKKDFFENHFMVAYMNLMLEDEPQYFSEPRLSINQVPTQASNGRGYSGDSNTKRAGISRGIDKALDICVNLANCIYFSTSWDTMEKCIGNDTYQGD